MEFKVWRQKDCYAHLWIHDNATKTAPVSIIGMRAQQEEPFHTMDEACWMTPQTYKEPIRRLHFAESCNIYLESVLMTPQCTMWYPLLPLLPLQPHVT